MPKEFIVKVQLSIVSSEPERIVLIYNKSKKLVWQNIAPDWLIDRMGKEIKKFFYASDDGKKISINEEAPWQNW